MRMVRLWSMGVAGFLFAIFFGRWAQSLFLVSETVHFSANFPSDGRAQTMSCCDLGGPWARDRDPDWNQYAAGGVLTWGEEGQIVIDVGRTGLIKRLIQPYYLTLSSHWIRNVGTQPYRLRFEMDMCGWELEWDTFERDWDLATKTSTRAIEPGETFNMDWYFHVPPEARDQSTLCDGRLRLFDADAETLLTELPIRIVDSRAH